MQGKKKKEKKVGNEKIGKRLCGKTKKYLGRGGGEHIAAFAKDRYRFYIYIYIYIVDTAT